MERRVKARATKMGYALSVEIIGPRVELPDEFEIVYDDPDLIPGHVCDGLYKYDCRIVPVGDGWQLQKLRGTWQFVCKVRVCPCCGWRPNDD